MWPTPAGTPPAAKQTSTATVVRRADGQGHKHMPGDPSRRRHCRTAAATKSTPSEGEVAAGRTNAAAEIDVPSAVRVGADTRNTTKVAGRDAKKVPRGQDANVLDNHGDGRSVDSAAIRQGKRRCRDGRARQGRPAARRAGAVAASAADCDRPQPSATRPGRDSCRLNTITIVRFTASGNCTCTSCQEIRCGYLQAHQVCWFVHTHFLCSWMAIFLRTTL